MRLTKREQELSKASEKGRKDFEMNRHFLPEDKSLHEAYSQGWNLAKQEQAAWDKLGYY